jgi:hypothetical protein
LLKPNNQLNQAATFTIMCIISILQPHSLPAVPAFQMQRAIAKPCPVGNLRADLLGAVANEGYGFEALFDTTTIIREPLIQ